MKLSRTQVMWIAETEYCKTQLFEASLDFSRKEGCHSEFILYNDLFIYCSIHNGVSPHTVQLLLLMSTLTAAQGLLPLAESV